MPYIIKYTDINTTINYGKTFFDYLSNNFLSENVLVNNNNLKIGKLVNVSKEPVIYIYNTHQKEAYQENTVYEASLYLKEKLDKKGLTTLVEASDINKILKERDLPYPYTYSITRELALNNMTTYGSIKILIDLHRDSAPKEVTTAVINNQNYAKMMFLIGTENANYEQNDSNMKIMKDYLDQNYNGLMRNTYYCDDTYNQDISTNLFSIEVGAQDNTFEEVKNSLNSLSEAIEKLIKEQNE